MNHNIKTDSAQKTQELGESIVSGIEGSTVIALYGDLGSGKTTFVKGIASALKIASVIKSPTFVLLKEYPIEDKKTSINKLYHLDLYRLSVYEKDELGLQDLFQEQGALIIIEWAERAGNFLPSERIDIFFEHITGDLRSIKIKDSRA